MIYAILVGASLALLALAFCAIVLRIDEAASRDLAEDLSRRRQTRREVYGTEDVNARWHARAEAQGIVPPSQRHPISGP